MLQADNLTKGYGGEIILKDISFSIQKGERCGLVGRNGSGKTTLFRIITGEEHADKGSISSPKSYSIGYLNQHIKFSSSTILEEGALGLPEHDKDSLYKVEKILAGLGFKEEQFYDCPSTLSGGYHLRLHLAKVLLSEPDCLLLDEPTNYLDIASIRWLEKALKQWKGEFVLISHDREFMDSVTTHTMGIHRQKMKKVKGSTVDFYTQVVTEEEIHEKTRIKMEKKRSHAQSFVDRFGAKASKAAQAQSRVKLLARIPTLEKLMEIYQLDFSFKEAFFPGKKMLDAVDLNFSYEPNESELIKDVSIDIEKGERIAIIGKNGRGKSTLLKLLAGELEAQSGTIKRSDNLKIGYFGQTNINRLHPQMTIEEEISVANSQLTFTEARGICGLMMFGGDKAKKTVSVLSGGEKSRVLLGKILATPCNLLLLDEPTHHLDMESIEALIDALEEFEGTVIIVTHSELILKRMYLDKIVVCHQGRQELFLGTYEDFLEKDGWHDDQEPQKQKKSSGNKKEQKQKRSEIISAKSKALKEIEADIEKHEKKLASLEKEQNDANLLISAGKPSGEILKGISERQKEIDRLYVLMEKLHAKHIEQSEYYAKLLDEN